ncbi:hypothetical protein HDV03_004191 [Kappamyces sp. JEL0829]|nr:hypothetical protein HDV03_004191 [Kappamyces sp. JEL0829]
MPKTPAWAIADSSDHPHWKHSRTDTERRISRLNRELHVPSLFQGPSAPAKPKENSFLSRLRAATQESNRLALALDDDEGTAVNSILLSPSTPIRPASTRIKIVHTKRKLLFGKRPSFDEDSHDKPAKPVKASRPRSPRTKSSLKREAADQVPSIDAHSMPPLQSPTSSIADSVRMTPRKKTKKFDLLVPTTDGSSSSPKREARVPQMSKRTLHVSRLVMFRESTPVPREVSSVPLVFL